MSVDQVGRAASSGMQDCANLPSEKEVGVDQADGRAVTAGAIVMDHCRFQRPSAISAPGHLGTNDGWGQHLPSSL